jgi:hypothetical protein
VARDQASEIDSAAGAPKAEADRASTAAPHNQHIGENDRRRIDLLRDMVKKKRASMRHYDPLLEDLLVQASGTVSQFSR